MSEVRINNLSSINTNLSGEVTVLQRPSAVSEGSFDLLLREAIGKLEQIQSDAEKAVKELARGGDITQAVIAMQKAELSFQLMVEVRNRLISAYEEIQRMQV